MKARGEETPSGLSSEEVRELIYELRTHQIELEMQNEELRRAQAELEAAREGYFDLYDLGPVSYLTMSEKGLILDANLAASTLLGVARGALVNQPLTRFIIPEDQDVYYQHRKQLFSTGAPQTCELQMLSREATRFWARIETAVASDAQGAPVCRTVVSNVTEHKQMETRERLVRDILDRLNRSEHTTDLVCDILHLIKKASGIEAVGIRLREGDDFPYYETKGFPDHFVQMERYLCKRDDAGEIVRDRQGNPVLECMCGNILCGRTNPALPFFTQGGSFWSNCTSDLLASTTEKDRQSRTRNRCNGEGYESVALIPLRTDKEIIGLLQLNDHRRNQFEPEMIRFYEGLGASVGIALARRGGEELFRKSQERFQLALRGADLGVFDRNVHTGELLFDKRWLEMIGYEEGELKPHYNTWENLLHPDDKERTLEALNRHFELGTEYSAEFRLRTKTGGWKWILARGKVVEHDKDGNPLRMTGTHLDINDRKNAEEKQKELESQVLQAQKLESIGTLAGGIAHDFNNILSIMVGYAELLELDLNENTKAKPKLARIKEAGDRARRLTKQILTFCRQEKVENRPVDVCRVAKEALQFLRSSIPTTIEIRQNFEPEFTAVLGGPDTDLSDIHEHLRQCCARHAREGRGSRGRNHRDGVDSGRPI